MSTADNNNSSSNTRFCSSCRNYKPDTGALVRNPFGKVVRWRCYECNIRARLRCDEIHDAQRQVPAPDKKQDN